MLWLVALVKRIKAFDPIINKSAIEKILLNTQSGIGYCYFSHIYKYHPSRWCVCVCVCLVIIRKACPCATEGYVFGKCHAPWTLKTAFVDFETEEVHCGCYARFNLSSILF